ncbi:hypothetical protein [Halomonas cupida]|uniref:Uncharacterized protein n=1 Tax=Halomonas cupida TaxID=44933 RepID=A0A1M7F1J8_9GAMM|nr:hypothetical protein [Halomonas cupida]GEN23361.1 hypothetical protein HCU01_13100 [Halomonas cupida]SHL97900.1 hypothetical protein SAMN05660971_01892 [Halomonas cupida]
MKVMQNKGQGGSREAALSCWQGCLVAVLFVGLWGGVGIDHSLAADLRPGVRPGEIVIIREVEHAPVGQVNRDSGPIRARADLIHSSVMANRATHRIHGQMSGATAVMLSDSQAAGITSGVSSGIGRMHQVLGTSAISSGNNMNNSQRLGGTPSGTGGGARVGGGVVGATSGIANTVTGALAPLGAGRGQ